MLYTELQLIKPKTIGEMFSVSRKVALSESSTLESTTRRKDKQHEHQKVPNDNSSNILEQRDKSQGNKFETFKLLTTQRKA